MVIGSNPEKTIGATNTAFNIIDEITRNGPLTVSEISKAVDCSRSTVYYHVKTLEKNRYVIQDEDGYRLGLRMAYFSEPALRHYPLYGESESVLKDLAEETGELAFVGVQESGKLLCLSRSGQTGAEIVISVGQEFDLHCLAHGQAIISRLPKPDIERIIKAYGLHEHTDMTPSDKEALYNRLELIKEIGVAYSREEYAHDISTMAAPVIPESTDEVAGAIGIIGPADNINNPYEQAKARRFSEEHPGQIRRAAQILGNHITGDR